MLEPGIKLRYAFNSRKSEEFPNQQAKQGIPNQRAQGRLGNGNAEAGSTQQQTAFSYTEQTKGLYTPDVQFAAIIYFQITFLHANKQI